MRICLIGIGNSFHIKRWINYFQKNGDDVYLISTAPGAISGVSHLPFKSSGIYRIPGIRGIFRIVQCLRYLKKINPDLIHLHMISTLGLVRIFLPGIPFIVSPWGYDIYTLSAKSYLFRKLSQWILKNADGITTTSDALRSLLIQKFRAKEERIKTFFWGIEYKLFSRDDPVLRQKQREKMDIPNDAPVFIMNRYFPAANYRLLWESFKKVLELHPEAVMIVVKGYTKDKFWIDAKEYAQGVGIDISIRWVEKVISLEEMASLVQASNIFLNIVYADQRSSSLIEAMAAGLVPLVNDLPVYREFLRDGENAVFVFEQNPEELASKMNYVLEHLLELQEKFKIPNQQFVRNIGDQAKQQEKMRSFYQEIVNRYIV